MHLDHIDFVPGDPNARPESAAVFGAYGLDARSGVAMICVIDDEDGRRTYMSTPEYARMLETDRQSGATTLQLDAAAAAAAMPLHRDGWPEDWN